MRTKILLIVCFLILFCGTETSVKAGETRMRISVRGREITKRPKKANEKKPPYEFKIRKVYIPPKDHPWRRYKTRSYPQYVQN